MYKLNSYVVYPMYGICKVIGISNNKVNSRLVECYVLECDGENITLKVPTNRVKEYRIRKIISKNEAANFLTLLQTKPHDCPLKQSLAPCQIPVPNHKLI